MRFLNWLIGYIDMKRELEEKDRVIADLREENDALHRQAKMAQPQRIGGYSRQSPAPSRPSSSQPSAYPDIATSVVVGTMFSNSPTKDTCSPSPDSGSSSPSSDSGSSSWDTGSF